MTFKRDESSTPKKNLGTRNSYDAATPDALVDFMLTKWKPSSKRLPSKIRDWRAFADRRRRVSKMFPGELLVIPTGHEKVRSNDTHFRFRPCTEFYYLTGNVEPDCVLVLEPQARGGHRDILFVEPNPGRSSPTFFTDRAKGELWVGPRLGVEQSAARYGVHECRPISELSAYLRKATAKRRTLTGFDPSVDAASTHNAEKNNAFATALSEMRLLKDATEIRELQSVIASTMRGFEDVIATLPYSVTERYVEGIFGMRARIEGNDVGYGTIAACGEHACILHWTRNDGEIDPSALLLLDAGVEGNSLYTADITRTLPVSGKFTKEQREIYDLVHRAQAAAFKEVKPGNDFMAPNRAAMHVLAHGLEKLGILPMSAAEALKDENQFYKRYTLHGVSHMLGLDVHDCAKARQEVYKYGELKAGMVLTVEPGLYFQMDDLTVPKKYRGIGVRIEDDVVVTKKGYRNLSAGIPSTSKDVEAWMKGIWAQS